MSSWLVVLLLQLATIGPEVDGELRPGPQCIPTYRATVCLVKSKPPKEFAGVIDCMNPAERELCSDETTFVLGDKLEHSDLLNRYPGSYLGACVGFVMPQRPKGAPNTCGP